MRGIGIAVVVALGCQQKTKPTEPDPAHPPVPAPAVDAAPGRPALVDLFATVPSSIVVSSRVANAAIKPEHIADRDLETAWNSATDELVGAWFEVRVPGATLEELRFTVGHTGQGPKHEDYFTMNPRIAAVEVSVGGASIGTFKLDIAKRELQTITVHATAVVHVQVTEVVPGSKPSWREIAISELQAWGTPPASAKSPAGPRMPRVTVAPPPVLGELDPCAGADAIREAFVKEHAHDTYSGPGADDHAYPPRCDPLEVPELPAGWQKFGAGCTVQDEIYGPKSCTITFEISKHRASVEVSSEQQSAEIAITSATDDPRGLVLHWRSPQGDLVSVCRRQPLGCSEAFPAAELATHTLVFK